MAVEHPSPLLFGRERELASLCGLVQDGGPRVCFVYGAAGIGKSALLAAFRAHVSTSVAVWSVDCATIDPTDAGFRDALAATGWTPSSAGVVVVDTYEVFRIADPWLRHELLPSLSPDVRFLVAGRDAPMLEWSVERGRLGGIEVLPLGPIDDAAAAAFLATAGVDDPDAARSIARLARGHPLALRMAAEANVADIPPDIALPRVVDALATAFREGLDDEGKDLLDAASVPRRVTRGVLAAMIAGDADAAIDRLASMSVVEVTDDGLRLHDAVHETVARRLRALDPERFRRFRTAAWRYLRSETEHAGTSELFRSTADLLFLIDNPVVREAMFPTSAHAYSVERARAGDVEAAQSIWHTHDTAAGAAILDEWLRLCPAALRVIRDRTGAVVGCSLVAEWRDVPASLERTDPVVAAWSRHLALHPLPAGQRTLTKRRFVAMETGEAPSGVQAAAWLDVKRDYFRMRPHIGRLYLGMYEPAPFVDAMATLGFEPFAETIDLGDRPFHLASLTFGPDSIDGWLAQLAAAELGIKDGPFLDPLDHSVDVNGTRVSLSPLEFGVMATLAERRGRAVARVDLLERVWGTSYDGGSNTVDAVVRTLRKKLGSAADRVETVRGVGYRLN